MARNIKGITIEIGGNTTKLQKELSDVDKSLKKTQDQLKDVNRLLKLDPKNTELLTQKQRALKDAIKGTQERLKTLKEAQKQAAEQLKNGDIGQKEYDALQREIAETEINLKSLKKEYKDFGSVAQQQLKTVGSKMQEVGQKMTSAGKTLSTYVTAPIVGVGAAAVKVTSDFDTAMSRVLAISGASADEFQQLRDKAREMGETTMFTAAESADALYYMALAGWDVKDMLDGLEGVMYLAAAGGSDLASTSDIVTDNLTAFGMSANEATHFADVLATAMSASNTTTELLGESFKYVAPVAGAMGYSVEDTAKALGLMANNGIKGSAAGTALRNILTNMANPSKEMAEAMDVLNISLDDGAGNMLTLEQVMQGLREGFGQIKIPIEEYEQQSQELAQALEDGTISEEEYGNAMMELSERAYGAEGAQKAQYASMLAGKKGMAGLMAIINSTSEEYNKLGESINGADGRAQEMQEIMQNNLGGQLTVLKSQLSELAIQFGDIMMPVIREVVGYIQDLATWFSKLDEPTKRMIITIAGIVAAVGPLLVVIGSIITIIGTVISVIGMITAPVLIVIGIIAAAIAIGILLYKNWDTIKAYAIKIWNAIKNFFVKLWNGIKQTAINIFNAIKNAIVNNWKMQLNIARTVWNAIKTAITTVVNGIKNTVTSVFNAVKSTISNIFNGIKNTVTNIWDSIKSGVSNKIEAVRSTITNGLQNALNFIRNLPSQALQWGRDLIQNFVNGIKQKISAVTSAVGNVAGKVAGVIGFSEPEEGPLSNFHTFMPDMLELMAKGIRDNTYLVTDAMENLAGKMVIGGDAALQNNPNMNGLLTALNQYLPYLAANQNIYLDTGALVGGTAPAMNRALGQIQLREQRR